jgi:MFS family permease
VKTPWRKLYVLSFAGSLSWLGSTLTTFAVILRDKDSVGAVGISGYLLAFGLPTIFMAPVSGLIADKFSSRAVILPALAVMGLGSISLALGWPLWWTPFALLITAMAGTIVGPAFQAAQVSVTAKEDIPRVSGLMQSMASAGTLFAPALGGILIATTGYFWPFVIDAFSFWLLGVVFFAIGIDRKPVKHEVGEKMSATAGLKFVFNDRLIRAIAVLSGVLVIALGTVNVGEVFLAQNELHADTFTYGIISALFAGGSIVGSIGTAALKLDARRHALAILLGIALLIATVFFMSVAWHWGVLMVLSFIAGLGNAILNAYGIGIVMARAPEEALGRVNSAIGAVIQAGSVIGIVAGGLAIELYGIRAVLMAAAILSAIILLVFGPEVMRAGREHRIAQ